MPSQSPVPVGLRPAGCPKGGTRAGSRARLLKLTEIGAEMVDAASAIARVRELKNGFIFTTEVVEQLDWIIENRLKGPLYRTKSDSGATSA